MQFNETNIPLGRGHLTTRCPFDCVGEEDKKGFENQRWPFVSLKKHFYHICYTRRKEPNWSVKKIIYKKKSY